METIVIMGLTFGTVLYLAGMAIYRLAVGPEGFFARHRQPE
jgi:hypothetical protein